MKIKKTIAILFLSSVANSSDVPSTSSQEPGDKYNNIYLRLECYDGQVPITEEDWDRLTNESQVIKDLNDLVKDKIITKVKDDKIPLPSFISKITSKRLLSLLKESEEQRRKDIDKLSLDKKFGILGCAHYLDVESIKNILNKSVAYGLINDGEGFSTEFKKDPWKTISAFSRTYGINMNDTELGYALVEPYLESWIKKPIEVLSDAPIISSISWSPNGKYLATGSYRKVRIWNSATWAEEQELCGCALSPIITWSSDGKYLATGESQFWDTATWHPVSTLNGIVWDSYLKEWSPDKKYLASHGLNSIKILSACTRQCTHELNAPDVRLVAWSPDGNYIASAGLGRVYIWDTKRLLHGFRHMPFVDALILTYAQTKPGWTKTKQAQALIQARPWRLRAGNSLSQWFYEPKACEIFNAITTYEDTQDQKRMATFSSEL